ncbi:DUF4973 domain-containing protein [Sphingobacterium rhinopitheci]|uniref:DUF4973 domain-containing protein n=1 Tax=Sphingobacterium rhinopitheci TaxID=2781960 RepID=UPI001F51A8C8|nr:DUF4973 domain-containing protein [Sphingobacterium rhinopitheci]MCI0922476.1 DUF4973 domain-containing protein [Sphingobacterium rhinopitheci]
MKKSYIHWYLFSIFLLFTSCNDEWKEEQYEQYISFKAPLESEGITNIYVRYREQESSTYLQPLVVSGSTFTNPSWDVYIGVDTDTLNTLNYERFQNRLDFYFRELNPSYYSFPSTVNIENDKNVGLLKIDFKLKDIDMAEKWVLPLSILNDPANKYRPHPRKHYSKALLRINPFNDYSGTYSGTALKISMAGYENETPIVKSDIKSYVVDENTIFFYAGNIDEERSDRRNYKIYATFLESGSVNFWSDNPELNFKLNKDASYTVTEQKDAVRPYLLHRYITINNIDYLFTDYTMVPNYKINYSVNGSLILERQLNTQIPDEDQSIEW